MTAAAPLLSLAYLTVPELTASEQVAVAAEAGYPAVGLRLIEPPGTGRQLPSVAESGSLLAETAARLSASGVAVLDIESLFLTPETRAADHAALLEAGARLGARFLLTMCVDGDGARAAETFAALCALAAPLGITVVIEFARFTEVKTLAEAARFVGAAGQPNGAILIDVLHLFRSGGAPADLGTVPPALLPYAQLCDASGPPPADLRLEARGDRRYPGEGDLPLAELLAALPAGVPLAVEAPCRLYAHLPPLERARRALAATRALLTS